MKKINKNLLIGIILGIFFIAFVLRFYNLGVIPAGLEQDESSIGYNAYSILQTGKDEYGKPYPLYFKAFGEYKLPAYIYAAVPSIKIFGLNEFAVRFPSALSGFLTVIVFYFLLRELIDEKDSRVPILATLLLAINPWHIHFSRGAFEVSLALFFITFGTLLFLYSLKKKYIFLLPLSTLMFVASVYTYNIARVWAPLFVIFLLWFYRKNVLKNRALLIICALLALVTLAPYIMSIFSKGGVASASGQLIFSSKVSEAAMIELRSNMGNLSPFFVKILYNRFTLILWQYVNNILSYLSVQFFFVSGSDHGNHGIGNVGQFYAFELPLILWGLYTIIREKIKWGIVLMVWGAFVILVASLTREIPQATRSFFLIIPLCAFSSYGLFSFWKWISIQKMLLKQVSFLFFGIFALYNIVFYINSYYYRFPIYYSKQWRQEDKAVSQYIHDNDTKYSHVLIDKKADFLYTSYLFYTAFPPEEFQRTVNRAADDSEGFSDVISFGKFEYKDIDWSKDYKQPDGIIITKPNFKPNELPPLISFYYPRKNVVLSVKEELAQYPIEDIAYTLVDTNRK